MTKVLFIISIMAIFMFAGLVAFTFYKGQNELAIIFSLLTGAMILNCGNFYGYIKNEDFMKRWEEANKG